MTFDHTLLEQYRVFLQTTDLQKAWQEVNRFFRYLRSELEKQMPDYKFQGGISESALEYSYFSFTSDQLKAEGLKLIVLLDHKSFRLEVLLCGYNRKIQCDWARRLGGKLPVAVSEDPAHTDYIVRLSAEADFSEGAAAVAAVKAAAEQCRAFLTPWLGEGPAAGKERPDCV